MNEAELCIQFGFFYFYSNLKMRLICLIIYFIFSSLNLKAQREYFEKLDSIENHVNSTNFQYSDTSSIFLELDYISKNLDLNNCEEWYAYHRIDVATYYNIAFLNEDSELFNRYLNLCIDKNKEAVDRIINCFGEESEYLARTYYNIGSAHYSLIEDVETEKYYNKVLEVEYKNDNPSDFVCQRLLWIGEFYSNILGDREKGFEMLEVALTKLPKKNKEKTRHLIIRSQARAYFYMLEYEKSINRYLDAIEIATKIYPNFEEYQVSIDYEELAIAYLDNDQIKEAEVYINKAFEITRKYFPDRKKDLNRQLIRLQSIYSTQGKFEIADNLLSQAAQDLKKDTSNEGLLNLAYINAEKGMNFSNWGKHEKAVDALHESFFYMVNNNTRNVLENPIIANNQILFESIFKRVLKQKCSSFYSLFKTTKNEIYLKSSIDGVLKIDSLITLSLLKNYQEGSHQVELALAKSAYEIGIVSSLELYKITHDKKDLEQAFQFTSKFKSRLLARGLNQKEMESEVLSDEQKAIIDSLRNIISEARNEVQIASLQKDTTRQRTLYEELLSLDEELKIFQEKNNIYNLLTEADVSKSYSISEIQNKINQEEAILEFHLADTMIYSFLISKNSFHHQVSKIKADQILKYYSTITEGGKLLNGDLSNQFYSILENISKESIRNIIIIPDGDLLQLPLEAISYNGMRVIEQFNISYEYSSSFLFDENSFTQSRSLTAFASDYTSSTFDSLHFNTNYGEEGIHLAELKNTIEEVDIAHKYFGGVVFKNEDATKSNFEANSNNNNILHLALHGVINNEIPDQSALVFSSTTGDNLLTASEIYNMDINNDLTILSACNTGVGPVRVGDGVRSMARSFIHAGSESVITSLWEISDVTTKIILEGFYKYINEGKTKAEALRLAKLDFISNASPTQQHPKYWAHLVLVGDPGPIAISSKLNWKLYGIIGIGILASFLLFRVATKSSSKK